MKTKQPTEIAEEVEKTHQIVEKVDQEMPKQDVIVLEDTAREEKLSHEAS